MGSQNNLALKSNRLYLLHDPFTGRDRNLNLDGILKKCVRKGKAAEFKVMIDLI